MINRIHLGDCRDVLRQLAQGGVRVQTCVTSPPYWGLRDYGVAGQLGLEPLHDCLGWATGDKCGECHVCHMVEVFSLVRDVLADDGTAWVNYGDCYASAGGAGWQGKYGAPAHRTHTQRSLKKKSAVNGLKPKDLVGMPWRVAFALQADGWYLRQGIIWYKPNAMPESVRDRCTKAHEDIFLLTKSERYFFDQEAIKEPVTGNTHSRGVGINPKAKFPSGWDGRAGGHRELIGRYARSPKDDGRIRQNLKTSDRFGRGPGWRVKQNESFAAATRGPVTMRNRRSVWTIPTQPYSGAHFATFPAAIVEPCILAGSRAGDVVLDPFFGSGTVGEVAARLGRQWVGIELNPAYADLAKARTAQRGLCITDDGAYCVPA